MLLRFKIKREDQRTKLKILLLMWETFNGVMQFYGPFQLHNQDTNCWIFLPLLSCPFFWPFLPVFNVNNFRVLEWGNGYYGGDIKISKTVQAVELNAEQLCLQRSEQLRQPYESLSAGESSPQPPRPSAALSPEYLTDTERYYLVCMSFEFNIGQG